MTRTEEVSDDMLMALADGELPETDARTLRQRIEADADLAARYAIFAETRAMLQAAFPPEPVPQHLIDAVMQGAESGPSNVVLMARPMLPRWSMALAASLVLAVGVAGFVAGRGAAPVTLATGPEAAAQALAGVPTGGEVTLADGRRARVLASYQTDLGLCRLIGTDALRAVACRAPDGWAVALTVTATGGEAYLPASDLGTALIDQLLDDIAASAPLDPGTEAQALAQ
ncbi:anti-sigma factor [Pseudotabrizicola sp.]|uniref:anti-sigma factor family protein n=1 Tax=Pseudotabrizicola sp. TaxID=2939647 RepID=UPI002725CAAD|nr:hypothetical protein [Pseudotabrizicola sp.]MDO8882642.1 hypothetical protein [Pseudotabrizicola sp.]